MATEKNEGFQGNSELMKAVTLLEENGFFVSQADYETIKNDKSEILAYTGSLLIRIYPKENVRVSFCSYYDYLNKSVCHKS